MGLDLVDSLPVAGEVLFDLDQVALIQQDGEELFEFIRGHIEGSGGDLGSLDGDGLWPVLLAVLVLY